jgi:hypothetical protein
VGRLLLVIAVILVLALVLGGVGALDDAANVIVQILRIIFNLLVRLINLFVELLKSIG